MEEARSVAVAEALAVALALWIRRCGWRGVRFIGAACTVAATRSARKVAVAVFIIVQRSCRLSSWAPGLVYRQPCAPRFTWRTHQVWREEKRIDRNTRTRNPASLYSLLLFPLWPERAGNCCKRTMAAPKQQNKRRTGGPESKNRFSSCKTPSFGMSTR